MLRPRLGLCLLALVCACTVARAQSFTLEQVMRAPFPSEPTVSKQGDRFAWVFDAEGRRNLWVADAPSFHARQLTRYTQDDGQEITALAFSPNGQQIAYVRGGGKNQAGEVPNPT